MPYSISGRQIFLFLWVIGFRTICSYRSNLYIGGTAVGFSQLKWPRLHIPVHLHATAQMGTGTSFMPKQTTNDNDNTTFLLAGMDDRFNYMYRRRNSSGIIAEYHRLIESGATTDYGLYLHHHATFNVILTSLLRSSNEENEHLAECLFRTMAHKSANTLRENGMWAKPDTLNIYLTYLFDQGRLEQAAQVFQDYVYYDLNSSIRPPTSAVTTTSSEEFNECRDRDKCFPLNRRTLNIMMEGFRSAGNIPQMLHYHSLFSQCGPELGPDAYTYSVLIRAGQSASEVMRTLRAAEATNKLVLTAPFYRCVVETLGQLGYPGEAVAIAAHKLKGNDSMHRSTRTADAVLAALLLGGGMTMSPSTTGPGGSVGVMSSLEFAAQLVLPSLSLSQRINGNEKSDVTLAPVSQLPPEYQYPLADGMIDDGTSAPRKGIACAGKGFCLLFNSINKRLQPLQPSAGSSMLHIAEQRRLRALRDELVTAVQGKLLARPNPQFAVDGRLIDAMIRCYKWDPQLATDVWKQTVMPCILAATTTSATNTSRPAASNGEDDDDYDNDSRDTKVGDSTATSPIVATPVSRRTRCLQNGLEALMFVYGLNERPDLGLGVAFSARKRSWDVTTRRLLGRSYALGLSVRKQHLISSFNSARDGRDGANTVATNSKTKGFGGLQKLLAVPIVKTMEQSLEFELGLEFGAIRDQTRPVKKIRLQFKDSGSGGAI